ncbi:MAG TPA: S-layer homology domain-containing protein [Clostridia bacterium]|nr:S-layer homology domain-containing protein [Clostridia bacterium]
MNKRLLTMLLAIALILSINLPAMAEAAIPASMEKPQNFTVRNEDSSTLRLRWSNPDSIKKLMSDSEGSGSEIFCAIDWRKNSGSWNLADMTPTSPKYVDGVHDIFFLNIANLVTDDQNTNDTFLVPGHLDPKLDPSITFDLKNNTYYFRIRYLYQYMDEAGQTKYVMSPYTGEAAIGKNASGTSVTKLNPPQGLKVAVQKDSNGKPYFSLNWTNPADAIEANKAAPVYHRIDFKVGNGKWYSETHDIGELPVAPDSLLTTTDNFNPVEESYLSEVVIEANTYYFRILLETQPAADKTVRSAFSNIASTAVESYRESSSWAVPELDKAAQYGLITDSIKDKMNAPITRQEFAELAVRLYEVYTGKKAIPASVNPFNDTKDPETLKAYELKIVDGMGAGKFAPSQLTNREQVATMLFRVARLLKPGNDFSAAGAPAFSDQKLISNWALDGVKYMSKNSILQGANGKFSPKGTCTREMAVIIATRVYEKYSGK